MGLDQFAYSVNREIPDVDFEETEEGREEIMYWRKHPNLHGWMEQLYIDKGGKREFNCTPVKLTFTDLDRLFVDVAAGTLPHTTGFFFGQSQPEDFDNDMAFITRAKQAIKDGKSVYYSSWW